MKLVLSDELYSGIHTSHLFVVCQWAYANEKTIFYEGGTQRPHLFFRGVVGPGCVQVNFYTHLSVISPVKMEASSVFARIRSIKYKK